MRPPAYHVDLVDLRFLAGGLALLAWVATYVSDGVWLGDYWNHAAVVRELTAHPLNPSHPFFAVDAADAFCSPYAWVVAGLARITGMGPVAALSVAALANVGFLLWALRAFCVAQFGDVGRRAAFYAVPLFLFWWGDDPWFWSGFLQADVFGYVAPYPSTFCLGVTFLIWTLVHRLAVTWSWVTYALVTALLGVVILTHPTTAVFVAVGILALAVDRRRRLGWHAAWLMGSPALAFLAALAWPLYSLLGLLQTDNAEFHANSAVLYQGVWMRTAPILLASPVVLARLRKRRTDPLAWTLVGLGLVYGLGYQTGKLGLGRSISHLAIVVHLVLAERLAYLEGRLRSRPLAVAPLQGLLIALLVWFGHDVYRPAQRAEHARQHDPRPYEFLSDHVRRDDVILADLGASWVIPSFGGKVVAAWAPMYWIDDHERRRLAVHRFLGPGTSSRMRRAILEEFDVDYVLLTPQQEGYVKLEGLAREVVRTERFALFAVGPR